MFLLNSVSTGSFTSLPSHGGRQNHNAVSGLLYMSKTVGKGHVFLEKPLEL